MPRPCCVFKGLDCLSHLIYTVRQCLINTNHAATAVLKAISQGYGTAWHGHCRHMWINVGHWEMACERPAHVLLHPATTWTFTKVINQNAAAFGDVFNCYDDKGDGRLYRIWTNLQVNAILSSIVMLHLHCVLFFFGTASSLCSNYI